MVLEKIKSILAEQLDADIDSMTAETRIAEDLGADSLDVVELLMSIEDEFSVEIPDEAIERMRRDRWQLVASLPERMQKKYLKKIKDDNDKIKFAAGVMNLPVDEYMDVIHDLEDSKEIEEIEETENENSEE